MKINKDIKECPYCGSKEYYIKRSYSGDCQYNIRFDGKIAENGHLYDDVQYKNKSKYAWCKNCDKRLFKLEQ